MEGASEGQKVAQGSVRDWRLTPQNRPCRYAIYTRQSTEPRDGLSSCEAQFQVCRDYAEAVARPGDEWIGKRFDDEGASGRTLHRPALNRLRAMAKAGAIDRVYAVALDRYSRDVADTVRLFDEFERAGVEVLLAFQPELCSAPESRLLRHILASFAQFEREIIAARIAETRAYLKKHGRRLAGPAPYGYDADPFTKQLVPNRVEARRVRAIFRRAAKGQTPSEIARRIDHLGWRTKQWVSKRSGGQIGGGRWTARQVLAVLRNPVYTGRFADGALTRHAGHDPVVGLDLFETVQRVLSLRRSGDSYTRSRAGFPLRNKIVCPKCGRRLCTYTVTHRRGPQASIGYRYSRCRSTAGGRPPCRGVQFPAGPLEEAARDALAPAGAWTALLDGGLPCPPGGGAEALAAVWSALDAPTRDRLLARIVDSIEISRRKPEMRITFAPDLVEAMRPVFQGFPHDAR